MSKNGVIYTENIKNTYFIKKLHIFIKICFFAKFEEFCRKTEY